MLTPQEREVMLEHSRKELAYRPETLAPRSFYEEAMWRLRNAVGYFSIAEIRVAERSHGYPPDDAEDIMTYLCGAYNYCHNAIKILYQMLETHHLKIGGEEWAKVRLVIRDLIRILAGGRGGEECIKNRLVPILEKLEELQKGKNNG